ncbi:hypothetical protein [Aquisalimonas asiatica]|uniref:Uncharacterized protein n=1 Tax=Aquisalimonas asiatica TaxID=406100 RepID=A0A1H8RNG0_9GAMM|nr:hypothetical protein [Aquisalimonas asiatica]SEO67704.1 hypothetical protein SAMN04488052_102130 [Aquisalimonas asiatica]
MSQQIIELNGRYAVVKYTRSRPGSSAELRFLVIDRSTRSVVGPPLGHPDENLARAFARRLSGTEEGPVDE